MLPLSEYMLQSGDLVLSGVLSADEHDIRCEFVINWCVGLVSVSVMNILYYI